MIPLADLEAMPRSCSLPKRADVKRCDYMLAQNVRLVRPLWIEPLEAGLHIGSGVLERHA